MPGKESPPPNLVPVASASETARFGRPIARLTVDHPEDVDLRHLQLALRAADADVVILRYPNKAANLFAQLVALPDHDVLFADCLLYWSRELPHGGPVDQLSTSLSVQQAPPSEVGELVRPVFEQYPSHYAANPLFPPDKVLEGYVEWVTTLVAEGRAVCLLLLDEQGQRAGFAVTDFSEAVPDVRFGGINPDHRGRGVYRELIVASMALATELNRDRITISTQAHNVTVMSTWARLGFTATKALTTVHLVRRGLLPR